MNILALVVATLILLLIEGECRVSLEQSQFHLAKKCPVATKVRQFMLASRIQCAAACSRAQFPCDAFHFDPSARLCYLGDACSTLTQWTDGPCDSYIYKTTSAEDANYIACDLFSQLQMKMFYRFKKNGLVNEVDPKQFNLNAFGVKVGNTGAQFNGSSSSYLSTSTPGFEQFLDNGNSYSFFLKVLHANTRQQRYFKFSQCNNTTNVGNSFTKDDVRVYGYAFWAHGGYDKVFSMSDDFLVDDGNPALVSTGFAYSMTGYLHFYFNRTLQGSRPNPSYSTARVFTDVTKFQCLNIGLGDGNALQGDMHCFGMSTKALSLDEFIRLQDYCDAI